MLKRGAVLAGADFSLSLTALDLKSKFRSDVM
jgi:hypothetical protein